MNKLLRNENGFGAVEIIMLIVIIGLLGTVGYFVYKNHHQPTKVVTVTKTVTNTPKTTTLPTDITASWTSYKSTDGHYSLKYPSSWVTASNPTLCSSGILLVAPDTNSIGKCGSEDFGQISFSGMTDSSHLCYDLTNDTTWTNVTKSTISVSGITLTKQTGTSLDGAGNGSLPKGTVEVNYCYSSSSYGFMARYDQKPTDQNVLNDFNTIVTKTLSFTN